MKSITIRGIDPLLEKKLKTAAQNETKSINQIILDSLQNTFGLKKVKKFTKKYHDLDHLFGKWSKQETEAIDNKINSERKIDSELWK